MNDELQKFYLTLLSQQVEVPPEFEETFFNNLEELFA
jgi:hypothetical protein